MWDAVLYWAVIALLTAAWVFLVLTRQRRAGSMRFSPPMRPKAPRAQPRQDGGMRLRKGVPTPSCSFCRKGRDEVYKLVAGPGVYICNECVMLCHDFVTYSDFDPAAPAP